MAVRATAQFSMVRYDPGNPQFPTLPDGIPTPHLITYGSVAGLRARARIVARKKRAAAPAIDNGQYAGWQTETTWVNPYIVDFGVIPSPVQRTVSLYNSRRTAITVTGLSTPTGVTLLTSLPVTLDSFAGVDFTLEAGTTGDNSFDEIVFFTTSEGLVPVRMIGRRIFTLEVIPQAPMRETLYWKTDLIRSRDGTEKAYSLLQAPTAQVEYRVFYDQDNNTARAKLRNQFIAGESALVVSGQKWYEMKRLSQNAASTDTSIFVNATKDWSVSIGDPISVVANDLSASASVVADALTYSPDPYIENVTVLVRWDESNGALSTTELVSGDTVTINSVASVSTAQSKFGGASLHVNQQGFPTPCVIPYREEHQFAAGEDFTIDFWMRPTSGDIASSRYMVTRWDSRVGGAAGYVWWVRMWSNSGIIFGTRTAFDSNEYTFAYGSPFEVQADTWHYIRVCRSGEQFFLFVDGVQLDNAKDELNGAMNLGVGVDLFVGARYIGGSYIPFEGYIDDLRITKGVARSIADFTPPTEPHTLFTDQDLEITLAGEIGTAFNKNSFVMPVGLGYVSRFPRYSTHRDNLEVFEYTLTFNQEADYSNLDTLFFPTLTDLQSPETTLPILEFPNIIRGGGTKSTELNRTEDALDSGLSNRLAFSWYTYADESSEFAITIYSEAEMWAWRTFFHYLRGSYGEFYVPTFTDDIPGVTTSGGGNTFTAQDTDMALLFGTTPDPRRSTIRLEFDDGTIEYRHITAITDNGATEDFTVSSVVTDGTPKISFMQRCRILGDTVTIEHERTDYAFIKFRYRTVLL